MKRIATILVAAACWASPALATDAPPPSPADEAQIDGLILPFIAGLKAGKIKEAIATYMASNAMTRRNASEGDYVALQAQTVITTYGPISDCQLVEKANRGSWVQTRLYVCQHANYLTRWIFTVVKTPQAWQASSFRYDDKFVNDLNN